MIVGRLCRPLSNHLAALAALKEAKRKKLEQTLLNEVLWILQMTRYLREHLFSGKAHARSELDVGS
jgi:hypothetical protein